MRADYVTRWLLSVLSQCRALTLDFYLFREMMIALLIMYRWGCVICLECIIKKEVVHLCAAQIFDLWTSSDGGWWRTKVASHDIFYQQLTDLKLWTDVIVNMADVTSLLLSWAWLTCHLSQWEPRIVLIALKRLIDQYTNGVSRKRKNIRRTMFFFLFTRRAC